MKIIRKSLLVASLLAGLNVQAVDSTAAHKAEMLSGNLASQVKSGKVLFNSNCAACHQTTGLGMPGVFPPLAKSDFALKDKTRTIKTVIGGLTGPVTVNGKTYNAVMPNFSYLKDADVADIITYVTHSWGNDGFQVSAADVAAAKKGHVAAVPTGAKSDHPGKNE